MNRIDSVTASLIDGYYKATGRPKALVSAEEYLLFRGEAVKEIKAKLPVMDSPDGPENKTSTRRRTGTDRKTDRVHKAETPTDNTNVPAAVQTQPQPEGEKTVQLSQDAMIENKSEIGMTAEQTITGTVRAAQGQNRTGAQTQKTNSGLLSMLKSIPG